MLRVAMHVLICAGFVGINQDVPARHRSGGPSATVPFRQIVSGGPSRPIIASIVNGHPINMMIHSNASFSVQLTHGQARALGVSGLTRVGTYGIDRGGHVSDKGHSKGFIAELAVGRSVSRQVPLDVFEVPLADEGMLGIDWIRSHRLIIDYRQSRATVDSTPTFAARLRTRLVRQGYKAVPMMFENDRYVVTARAGNVDDLLTVGTASNTSIEPFFAHMANVEVGRQISQGQGPTGTTIPIFAPRSPLTVKLGNFVSKPVPRAQVLDTYAYLGKPVPEDKKHALAGALGSDFLTLHEAVVDFGSRTLYVR